MSQAIVEHSRGELLLTDPAITECGTSHGRQLGPAFTRTKRWKKFKRKAWLRQHFTGFSTLSGKMSSVFQWNATVALTGQAYNPSTNSSSINKQQSFGNSVANTSPGGCDECFSFQQPITAGSSVTLNLDTMTDLLQRASTAIVRIKGAQFRVLSASDDSTISPAPTATSVGLVTNNTVAAPAGLYFSAGGSGLTLTFTQTGGAISACTIGTAGSGYLPSAVFVVAPAVAAGTGGVVAVTTNSGGVPTAVAIVNNGAGYSNNNNAATVAIGQHIVYTGGYHTYADPSANGFCPISSTQKNILLQNLDTVNAITFECDVFGATT